MLLFMKIGSKKAPKQKISNNMMSILYFVKTENSVSTYESEERNTCSIQGYEEVTLFLWSIKWLLTPSTVKLTAAVVPS
jgi:hypothetical protein